MNTNDITGPDCFLYMDLDKITALKLAKLIRENYKLGLGDSLRMAKLMKQMFYYRSDSPYFHMDHSLSFDGLNLDTVNTISLTRRVYEAFKRTAEPLSNYQSRHCASMVLTAFNNGKIRGQTVNNCK